MRIMHISNNYTPYAGGLVSSLNSIIPALQEVGHEVMLIVPEFTQAPLQDPEFVSRIPSFFRFFHRNNPCVLSWRPTQFIYEKVHYFKPDIIHVHHPFLLGSSGSSIARLYNLPSLFTYHTMYEQYAHYVPLPTALTIPFITSHVLNFCNNQVNAIIAPSEGIKQWLIQQAVQTPLHVIPSPIQDHFFQNLCVKDVHRPLRLLYVGRLVPEKNVGTLIDLFSTLDHTRYRLTLVGFGSEENKLRHQAYVYHGISEQVLTFIIKPSIDTLLQSYRDADLFLFPSVTDTQGLVLAEAMAAGLPIIAFDGCGQRDSVIGGENGFLVATTEQMKDRIEQLYYDRMLWRKLSENAHKRAQFFSKHQIIERLVALYEQHCS